jgi:type II secretory pathway pseudopilin PulG
MPYCPQCGREVSPAATRCAGCGAPIDAAPRPGAKGSRTVLWVVAAVGCGFVAIVLGGIVAAIVIPSFLDSLHKAKQKRTLADLRDVGTAIESYRADQGRLPAAGSIEELAAALEPGYLPEMPRADSWGHPFVYSCTAEGSTPSPGGACDGYRLVSPGRDGAFEHEQPSAYAGEAFAPTDYDRDLVFADGFFLQYPELSTGPGS